jgi:hypothetical protein
MAASDSDSDAAFDDAVPPAAAASLNAIYDLLRRGGSGASAELERAYKNTAAGQLHDAADRRTVLSVVGAFSDKRVLPDAARGAPLTHSYVEGSAAAYALRFEGMRECPSELLRELADGGVCHAERVRDVTVFVHSGGAGAAASHATMTIEVSLWRAAAAASMVRRGAAALMLRDTDGDSAAAAAAAYASESESDGGGGNARKRTRSAAATAVPALARRPVALQTLLAELPRAIQRKDDAAADTPLLAAVCDAVHNMRRAPRDGDSSPANAMPPLETRYMDAQHGAVHVLAFDGVDRVAYRFLQRELCTRFGARIVDVWIAVGDDGSGGGGGTLCVAVQAAHASATLTSVADLPPLLPALHCDLPHASSSSSSSLHHKTPHSTLPSVGSAAASGERRYLVAKRSSMQ